MNKQNRVAFFNILSPLLLNGIALISAPLIGRLLGDSSYGVVQISNIWVSVIAIAFTLQTQGTLVNARVEYPEEEQSRYQSSAMSLSVLLFALCSAVVLLFLDPLSSLLDLDRFLIGLMLLQAFGTFGVNFLTQKFIYEFKAGRNMLISLGISITTLVLSVVLILSLPEEVNYYGRVLAIAATYGIIGIPACVYILAKGKTFYNRDYWKFCVALAIPSVFYSLSDLVLGQSDMVMLRQMLGDSAAGQYGYARNFGSIMFMIFGALNNTWCPFFFEDMKNGSREKLADKSKNFLELFTVLSVGFILLAPEVYSLYGGQEYRSGTALIPVFVSSYYLNFLCTFPVNYEYYHKKTKVVATVTVIATVVNLGLNFILIRHMGMLGAAVATAFSHCLQLGCHYVYTRYILGKGDYPFGIRMWAKYGISYCVILVVVCLLPHAGLLRWGVGAAVGLWEILRIRKRRVLI